MTESYPTICANVSLVENGGRVSFSYEGADELSKEHLNKTGPGDIDCAEPRNLGGGPDKGNGPVNLEFQLQTKKVTLDGIEYNLEFVGKQSVGIREAKNEGVFSFLRCLFEALHMMQGQFGGYTNPGGNPHKLKFMNQNNDKKEYKYTLRVRARAESGGAVLWLDDDPIIKNGGGGVSTN